MQDHHWRGDIMKQIIGVTSSLKKTCRFCNEINDKKSDNLFFTIFRGNPPNRVLKETKNFVVIPTIGQIIEGYLLIIPKKHFLSFAHLPFRYYRELETLKEETKNTLTTIYAEPIFYEHGAVGNSVEHAHLHAVPAEIDILQDIKRFFIPREIRNMSELIIQAEKGIPYLFYENRRGQKFIFNAHTVISQFLRQVVANKLGCSDRWNWKEYTGRQEILSTLEKLSFWKEQPFWKLDYSSVESLN